MRRRELLASAAAIAGVLAGPGLDSLLFDRSTGAVPAASLASVRAAAAAARADFQAVRYRQLSTALTRRAALDGCRVGGGRDGLDQSG